MERSSLIILQGAGFVAQRLQMVVRLLLASGVAYELFIFGNGLIEHGAMAGQGCVDRESRPPRAPILSRI
jgi:hypothetical protein